jgi:hypothetical protein
MASGYAIPPDLSSPMASWSYHPSERALHAFQYSHLSLTYAWTILVSLASGYANPMDTASPIASGNTAPRACFPWLPITPNF